MISLIKRNKFLLIWCLAYTFFVFSAFRESFSIQGLSFSSYLEGNLFNLQNYFLSISLFFTSYLYLMKRPFTSAMFVARCKNTYIVHILLYGIKICLFYMGLTIVLFFGFPLLYGIDIQFNWAMFLSFFNLFAYLYTIYLLYILALLLTGKQMIGVLSGFAINSSMLIVYWAARNIHGPLGVQLSNFLLSFYTAIALIVAVAILVIFRRKDFLL